MKASTKEGSLKAADEHLRDATSAISDADLEIGEAIESLREFGLARRDLETLAAYRKVLASVQDVLELKRLGLPRPERAPSLHRLRSVSAEVNPEVPDGRPYVRDAEVPAALPRRYDVTDSCGHIETGFCGHCQAEALLPVGVGS